MSDIPTNLAIVRQKIKASSAAAGRMADTVKLVAVSKGKTEDDVRSTIAVGQKVFGENRVQEAKGKFQTLRIAHPDLELHLIGPLQTNKVADAVAIFDVIETLDRIKLADALAKAAQKASRHPACYIEINVGGEAQKAGIAPGELDGFLYYCRHICGLNVAGLMCIPPQTDEPSHYFRHMKALADQYKLQNLSMGMSADYEAAIRQGATHVRVGTAIFGAR